VTDRFAEGSSRTYNKVTNRIHKEFLGTKPQRSRPLAKFNAAIRELKKQNRRVALTFLKAIAKPGTTAEFTDDIFIFLQKNGIKITIMKKHSQR
jgi:hypothetical protein